MSLKQTTSPREQLANISAQLMKRARQSSQRGFAVTRTDISGRKRLRVRQVLQTPDQASPMVDGRSAIRTFTSKFLWKFDSNSATQSEYIRNAFFI
jgi:hypothetical protein